MNDKILLVDDEPQVLVALEDLLSETFSVLTAGSAEQARAIVASEPDIAVLLTDQRMPRATGDQLLASLNESCDARCIMLTGYADLSAVVRAVNEGRLFAYVTKPWDPDDLLLKVSNAASNFRLARRLAYEQQLLRDLMDNSPDGIYFKDTRGRFLRANRAFAELVGAPSSDRLIGRSLREFLPNRQRVQRWEEEDRAILRSGRAATDLVREYPNGPASRWISETIAPFHSKVDAELVGFIGILRDVTQRIADQEELRLGERRFREQSDLLHSILDGMRDGVVFADPLGTPVYLNRHAVRMLPASAGTLPIDNWSREFSLVKADTRQPFGEEEDPLSRAVSSTIGIETEVCFLGSPSGDRVLQLSSASISSELGSTVGVVILLRDVTEQRRLEQQVAQMDKLEAIGRLAGGVAHDFNNLLGAIQGYGEFALQALQPGEPPYEDVKEMLRTAERAAALTRRLLEFSRQRVVHRRSISLNAVVRSMEDMLRRLLGELIVVELALDDSLGSIWADAGQIEQVILNLVINARDAMPNGGTVCICTFEPADPEALRLGFPLPVGISIQDTGSGIDAATQSRMFQPFFTTKSPGKGTGLGLSTVNDIVQQSDGEIRVDSTPGKGSKFVVYFPRVEGEPDVDLVRSRQTTSGTCARILLVEDDATLRSLLARALRAAGHSVVEADNGSSALQLGETDELGIELLITDVVMPGLNGVELARALRLRNAGLRVLFVSGYGHALNEAEPMPASARLDKPFLPASLLRVVGELLADSKLGTLRTGA